MDPQLIFDVNVAEGRKLVAYKDPLGNWTAGVGHLLFPQSVDWTGFVSTEAQVDSWLAKDLAVSQGECRGLPEWSQLNTPCRQNAMIECVFNLGIRHWFAEFPKTRTALFEQDWPRAHDHLLSSPEWVKQVGIERVSRLANYFLTGVYP
jgi:GH24 family phage-related lysozyme (muramidase)